MSTGQTNNSFIPLTTPLVCLVNPIENTKRFNTVVGLGPDFMVVTPPDHGTVQKNVPFSLRIETNLAQSPQTFAFESAEKSADGNYLARIQKDPSTVKLLNQLITRIRKNQHIEICQNQDVEASDRYTGFQRLHFLPTALPRLSWNDLNIRTSLLGYECQRPFLITGMTGGIEHGAKINQRLAETAQAYGIPMGVGSQRLALEHPEYAEIFAVKKTTPNVFLIANIGMSQLSDKKLALKYAQDAVAMIDADALAIHCNVIQELVQYEGDRCFPDLIENIQYICHNLQVPVIIKEVGCGIDLESAKTLVNAGVSCIDVGGKGGTSWAYIESQRNSNAQEQSIGETFRDWGIPTAYSLSAIATEFHDRLKTDNLNLIATGGIRDGLTIAKAVALGASVCGIGLSFFKAALISTEKVMETVETLEKQLKITMLATNSQKLSDLSSKIVSAKPYANYIDLRLQQLSPSGEFQND